MPHSKSFVISLAFCAAAAVAVLSSAPSARVAEAQSARPLSTKLTPAMIDYFALDVALQRPDIASLAACGAQPTCARSDSAGVRFVDSSGTVLPMYDGKPTTTIEQVLRLRREVSSGVSETRTLVRHWSTDDRRHIVMSGSDSIVKSDVGAVGRLASTLTRVHRYSDVRYVVNDAKLVWPITGLVVLELSNAIGAAPHATPVLASHAAVSFDGSPFAHVLTTNGLSHRVNLPARLLETTMPDR